MRSIILASAAACLTVIPVSGAAQAPPVAERSAETASQQADSFHKALLEKAAAAAKAAEEERNRHLEEMRASLAKAHEELKHVQEAARLEAMRAEQGRTRAGLVAPGDAVDDEIVESRTQ